MKLLTFYEIIFQCVLILLALYYVFKHEYKIIKSVAMMFVLSFLPALSNALFRIKIDTLSILIYFVILFMAMYLGSGLKFYDKYKWWDRIIHFLSGAGFVGFGIAIAGLNPGVSKWGLIFFGTTFSITLHVIWEVLEYISDCLTHGDAQRWQKVNPTINHVSEKAIQPAGLVDTMNDFICCIAGTVIAIIFWSFVL
jgi:hypothetical protein